MGLFQLGKIQRVVRSDPGGVSGCNERMFPAVCALGDFADGKT
jgi:predicted transcriptional regulator with HTH domain